MTVNCEQYFTCDTRCFTARLLVSQYAFGTISLRLHAIAERANGNNANGIIFFSI